MACVCRAWRDVAKDMPSLWTNLDLSLPKLKVTNAVVEAMASSGVWSQVSASEPSVSPAHAVLLSFCLIEDEDTLAP